MFLDSTARNLASLQSRYLAASRRASSGARIGSPSDDPVGAAQLARTQGVIDETTSYQRTIRAVRGDLELAEGALAEATSVFDRAHEIALQGANGSLSATDRTALAEEVKQLKAHLVAVGNTTGSQGYVFSGTQTAIPAFTNTGVFQGNGLDHVVVVGRGQNAVVNAGGERAFTIAGGRDVFADLDALQTALSLNDQNGVLATVNATDASRRQILAVRLETGGRLSRLETADGVHAQLQIALANQRHDIADVDPAAAFTELAALQANLAQSLETTRNVITTLSLSRFI
jgi:flagellar hook-associated protein 3 FlgL